jgi:iron only hydrogenase large subunit-like protein
VCVVFVLAYFKFAFLFSPGSDRVFDISIARDMSLIENCKEFVRWSSNSSTKGSLPMLASACPGEDDILLNNCAIDAQIRCSF